MAHGITLELRKIRRPRPQVVPGTEVLVIPKKGGAFSITKPAMPYTNPGKDRSLSGKARIRARRAARKAAA